MNLSYVRAAELQPELVPLADFLRDVGAQDPEGQGCVVFWSLDF